MTVQDAKLALIGFGARADEEMRLQLEAVASKVKRMAPWAAGAAVVMGLLAGRGARRKQAAVSDARRSFFSFPTIISTIRAAMPIVTALLAMRRKD